MKKHMIRKFKKIVLRECGNCVRNPDGSCPNNACATLKVEKLIEALRLIN